MLITKEQQEAWVSNYAKKGHSNDECIGFIDGVNKALDAVNKNFVKPDVSGQLPSDEVEIRKSLLRRIEFLENELRKKQGNDR